MPKQIRDKKLRDIYSECTRMQSNLMASDYSNKKVDICLGKLNVTVDLISRQAQKRKFMAVHKVEKVSLFARVAGNKRHKDIKLSETGLS